MSRPRGELSGDTLMPPGAVRPDLRPASEEAIERPEPTDPPGARGPDAWVKIGAPTSNGWNRIDDVHDGNMCGWEQT